MSKTSIAALVALFSAISVDAYPSRLAPTACFASVGSTVMSKSVLSGSSSMIFTPALNGTEFEPGQTYNVSFTIATGGIMFASSAGTWSTVSATEASGSCSKSGNTGVYTTATSLITFTGGEYMATWTAPSAGAATLWVSHTTTTFGTVSTNSIRITVPGYTEPPTASPTPSPGIVNANLCKDMSSIDTSSVAGFASNDVLACWAKNGTDYDMRLQVGKGFWGAIGVSTDNKMANTDIYWISYDGVTVTAEIRYATAMVTPQVESDPSYMANLVKVADGNKAQITFKRPAAGKGNRISMAESNFVLMATGAQPQSYHGVNRIVTTAAVDFASGSATTATISFTTLLFLVAVNFMFF